jgi:hypothetical protein
MDKIAATIGVKCGVIRYVMMMATKNKHTPGIKNSI